MIFEKSDGVGGTWHDNVYPGCRVDVSNHFYSYPRPAPRLAPALLAPGGAARSLPTCADRSTRADTSASARR
ncbi:MAG: hypothetical protein R3E53_09670 [Myxococcota bacterium]